jgi:hypothetical protein
MAAGIPAGIAGEVLGGRKERHEQCIVRGSVESPFEYAMCQRIFARFRAIGSRATGLQSVNAICGVNLSLRMVWRPTANFAKQCGLLVERKICDVA